MTEREHTYRVGLQWKGNRGAGTADYRSYDRAWNVEVPGKPVLAGSSDPAFRGDVTRYNPEELLVAALSSCHMLWYLHLCSDEGIIVVSYRDEASGTMLEAAGGAGGRFTEVVLRPVVTIARASASGAVAGESRGAGESRAAEELHVRAHELCFIARSVNFPVRCEAVIRIESA